MRRQGILTQQKQFNYKGIDMSGAGKTWFNFKNIFDKTNDEIFMKAQEELGRKVVLPEMYELFLDLDTEEDYQEMLRRLPMVKELLNIEVDIAVVYPSSSGLPKRHVILTMDYNLDVLERIIIQQFLMSDIRKEMHSLREVMLGSKYPILFVEGGKWSKGLMDWAKKNKEWIKKVMKKEGRI